MAIRRVVVKNQNPSEEELLQLEKNKIKSLQNEVKDLREVAKAMREWIDAVPKDTPLPAMPGFDREWADGVIDLQPEEPTQKSKIRFK